MSGAAIVIFDPGAESVATPLVRSALWYVQLLVEFLCSIYTVVRPHLHSVHSKTLFSRKIFFIMWPRFYDAGRCDAIRTSYNGELYFSTLYLNLSSDFGNICLRTKVIIYMHAAYFRVRTSKMHLCLDRQPEVLYLTTMSVALIMQRQWWVKYALVEWYWQGKAEAGRENPVPVRFFSTNATVTGLESSPALLSEWPPTNRLNHDVAPDMVR